MTRKELEIFLDAAYSKADYDLMFKQVAGDYNLFSMLWTIACEKPATEAWRILWILDHATEKRNEFIFPILDELYRQVLATKNESYIRLGMRLILRCPVNEDFAGELLDKCITWMTNPKAKISSQGLGLDFFYQTCKLYPEMAPELLALIDDIMERSPSAGYKVRLKRIREELHKKGLY